MTKQTNGTDDDGFGGKSKGVDRVLNAVNRTNAGKLLLLVAALVAGFFTWATVREGGWGDQMGAYFREEQAIRRLDAEARVRAAGQPGVEVNVPGGPAGVVVPPGSTVTTRPESSPQGL